MYDATGTPIPGFWDNPWHLGFAIVGGLAFLIFVVIPLMASIHINEQYDKSVIFRLGRFVRVAGAGVFITLPYIEGVKEKLDTRIISESFHAEQTLTKDTVPVTVEAVLFGKVVDVEKAVLQVEDYQASILVAAQTALRDVIGSTELQTVLSDRQAIDQQIQERISARASAWGFEVQSVEIRDVKIPDNLQDAMSRQAQAQREKQARVTLAEAETAVAIACTEAAKIYEQNPSALHLRGMNMLYEGLKEKGALIVVPSSAVDSMNLGTLAVAVKNGAPTK